MKRSLPLFLAFGCTEVSVSSLDNDPPVARIFSHRDGDVLLEGYTILLQGSASDDASLEEITATWFVDDVGVCTGPLDPLGNSACSWTVPTEDSARIRFQAEDRHKAKGNALLDLAIQPTEPPTITILEPIASDRFYNNVPIVLAGTAADAEDDPNDLWVTWESDRDGPLPDAATAPDGTGAFSALHTLSSGRHELVATVTDLSGKTGSDTVTIDVGGPNHPPTCAIISPDDGIESGEFNEVVFAATIDDDDEPADRLSVTWASDGTTFGTPTATVNGDVVYPYAGLPLGTHTITLTVVDDAGAVCTDAIQHIVVEPPSAPVVRISPEDPQHSDDLLCLIDVPSVDPQGDPVTYTFTWTYDGAPFTGGADTTTYTGDTVDAAFTAPLQVWECSVVATDGRTSSSPATDSVTIATPTVRKVVAGGGHTCQLDTADELICWGSNTNGQLMLTNGFYSDVGLGGAFTCTLDAAGAIRCVGYDGNGQVSGAPGGTGWVDVEGGGSHGCALDPAGAITCWGQDDVGQSNTSGLTGVYTSFASAQGHNCAIRDDYGMDCWGSGAYQRTTPVPGVQWSQVTCGAYHTCGLDLSGLAICWGNDASGEATAPLGTFSKISAGTDQTCGLRGTGAIECWGRETGPGEILEPPTGTYADVHLGDDFACAIDVAGAVTCWGDNSYGQLNAPVSWW